MLSQVCLSTGNFLTTAKETVVYVWQETGAKVALVFFRILEWVHPYWGPKLEATYLWGKTSWLEFKAHLIGRAHEEEVALLKGELEKVQKENPLLKERVRILEGLKEGLEKCVQESEREKERFSEDVKRGWSRAGELEGALGRARSEIEAMRQEKVLERNFEKMEKSVSEIVAGAESVKKKSELDDRLEKLLPLLLGQIGEISEQIEETRDALPPESAALISLESLERILKDFRKYFEHLPLAFRAHSKWKDPLRDLEVTQEI